MRIVALILICLISKQVFAFPELTRHGYANCMACHVSPSGGGVLTEYGQALSKELLSTWGREGEERFLYMIGTNSTLALGGDVRVLNLKDDPPNGNFRERRYWMQRDFEAALTVGKVTVAGTLGAEDRLQNGKADFISRRHYVIYQATDLVSLRAGRFYPNFGLYIPDHFTAIRRGLGWDYNQETYNLEAGWQNDKWNFFATGIFGRVDDPNVKREKGLALTVARNPSETSKYGASYYYGETDEITNHYVGPWAILGFTKNFFMLAQLTATRSWPYQNKGAHWGLKDYLRLNYELVQGFHVFLTQEFSQANLKVGTTRGDTLGLGVQWFPRPHWELQTQYLKVYSGNLTSLPNERLMFLLHFYL